jgi:nuclear transport factor 2 (NTF2) superfamily protein
MNQELKPPFTLETAIAKVQSGEDLWNSKDPEKISLAYTKNSQWRNRSEFCVGRDAIIALLKRKWSRELDYRLKKELFTFVNNKIGVHFEYEYRDDSGQWYRAYGNENWDFAESGLMQIRDASINEQPIKEQERRIF